MLCSDVRHVHIPKLVWSRNDLLEYYPEYYRHYRHSYTYSVQYTRVFLTNKNQLSVSKTFRIMSSKTHGV